MPLTVRQHHKGLVGLVVPCLNEDAFNSRTVWVFYGPADRCSITDRTTAGKQGHEDQACVPWDHRDLLSGLRNDFGYFIMRSGMREINGHSGSDTGFHTSH